MNQNNIDFDKENIKTLAEMLCCNDLNSFRLAYDIIMENKHIKDEVILEMIELGMIKSFYYDYETQSNCVWKEIIGNYISRTFLNENGRIQGHTYLLKMSK